MSTGPSAPARHPARGIVLALLLLLAACAGRFLVIRGLDGGWLLGWPSPDVIGLRLAPILCALVAGAALGSAGAVLQTLLRNPLASPFVLGISSGAGAGVALASVVAAAAGMAAPAGVALVLPAAIGAFTSLALVLGLSRRHGTVDPVTMVLAGVVVGTVAAALSMLAEALLPPDRRGVAAAWVLGRIPDVIPPGPWAACLLGTVGLTGLAAWRGRELDASALTDDEAASVGVALGRLRLAMFAACGLATAASVVLCGPIGFVGLLAPHLARPLTGPRNAPLVVASALLGAALLVAADATRQLFEVQGGRLPIGALTATLGGIAFLVLLRRTAGGWIR